MAGHLNFLPFTLWVLIEDLKYENEPHEGVILRDNNQEGKETAVGSRQWASVVFAGVEEATTQEVLFALHLVEI